jgi:putative transposase
MEEDLWEPRSSGGRELRQLREENKKLKQLVADLSLDKTILQEAMRRKW